MNAATIPTLASTPSHQLEDETELVERNLDVLSISSSQDDTPVPSMAVTEETERDQTTNASKESRTLLLNYNRFHDTINNEDFDSVKEMLDDGANVERGTNGGVTPLIMAIYKSHIAIITLLLESGANVNAPFDDLTPIFHAVMQKERAPRIIQLLLDYGANLEAVAGPGNTNALHFAAANGMIHAADFLIDKGLHISRLCAAEQTPLIFAARHGHLAIVKLLLAKGADLHERSSRSATALMGAARHGQDEVVRYLLDAGARVDDRSEDGHIALTFASTHGHLESVELLIQSGADINALSVSPERFTPAMYAAVMGHAEVLQTLLSHGAKFEGVSADGDTILELAMARGHLATTKILLEALGGPDYPKDSIALQMATAPSKTGLRPVMTAVSTMYRYINSNPTNAEGLGWIRWVLDEGGELVRSRAMCNMLYAAIMDRDPGVVAELLRLGADPNMAGFIGFTPLHSSVDTGNLEVIKTLLAVGADPAKLSKHTGRGCGVTPLDCAISRFGFDSEEDTAVIDMLLASGRCKVMKGEEALSTAFACVVSEFDGESGAVARDLAFRMLDSILDVNDHRSEDGSTLMHVAVHYNQKDLIDALRRKGADINAGDKDGLSPLLAACRMDVERVNFLITRCANVSAVTKHGQGALHIAAECGQVEVLRFLLDLDLADEESLDINAVDDAGYTPLIVAIVESQEDTALFLLERGASVSQRTADTGRLALHYAAQASMKRVVEKILEELEIKTEMGLKLDC